MDVTVTLSNTLLGFKADDVCSDRDKKQQR